MLQYKPLSRPSAWIVTGVEITAFSLNKPAFVSIVLNIRLLEPADRESLRVLAAQTVADGTVFPFESVDGVEQYWFHPQGTVMVAWLDDRLVGSYVVKPNSVDRCGHIANAGYMVDANWRGRGFGHSLGLHSLHLARSLGFRAMQFNQVVATNESAIAVWKKLGFVVIGTVPEAFRHPRDGWVGLHIMHRSLRDLPPAEFSPAAISRTATE